MGHATARGIIFMKKLTVVFLMMLGSLSAEPWQLPFWNNAESQSRRQQKEWQRQQQNWNRQNDLRMMERKMRREHQKWERAQKKQQQAVLKMLQPQIPNP